MIEKKLSGKRIAIAVSEKWHAEGIEDFLEEHGAKVRLSPIPFSADNVETVIETIKNQKPEALIIHALGVRNLEIVLRMIAELKQEFPVMVYGGSALKKEHVLKIRQAGARCVNEPEMALYNLSQDIKNHGKFSPMVS